MSVNSYKYLSDVYDELMLDVDYDQWAQYINKLLVKHRGNRLNIFEAGCGTGSISLKMFSYGHRIISTDISAEMLEIASENARKTGADINFIQQDMRRLSCTGKKDAVLACCDAVNYLTDDSDALDFFSSAFDILLPGGILLFDISSFYKLKYTIGNELFFEDGDETTYFWQNSFDESRNCVKMELTLFISDGDVYRRFDETHIQRAYTVDELNCLLRKAGFSDISAYTFLTENPAEKTDDRIQFAAIKKG